MADGSTLGLDPDRETGPYVRQLMRTLASDDDAIDSPLRLYEHKNGLFCVHGTKSIELVAMCRIDSLHSVEKLQAPGTDAVPTLRLNQRLAADLGVAALSVLGKKVELWQRTGSTVTRKASGSPAKHDDLDDFLSHSAISQESDCGLLAVRMGMENGSRTIGVAALQQRGRELAVGSFNEDEVFSQLEGLIVSTGAREVIFCSNDSSPYEEAKISEVLTKCGAAKTTRKKTDFSAEFIEMDLRTLCGTGLDAVNFLDNKLAMGALAGMIRFANLLEQPSLEGNVRLRRLDNSSMMKLDAAALSALNVFPKAGEQGKSSLFGLLNRTKSALGSRLLRRWIAQPLQDADEINKRLDVVEAFLSDPTSRATLREDHLRRVPDVSSICRKFQKKVISATLQDVVKLYQFAARLPHIKNALEKHFDAAGSELLRQRYCKVLEELSSELANFEALVETTIDLEQLDNHEFVINPNIDDNLMELKEKKDDIMTQISDSFEKTSRKLGLDVDKLKLEKKDNLGYFFRLTRKEEKLIRGKSAYLVIETRKDGVRFTNHELRRLSNQFSELSEEYEGKQSELKKTTLEVAGTYLSVFEDCATAIAEIDVLASFACVAADAPELYMRPTLLDAGKGLVIEGGRHPMVEECLDGSSFIANDVDLTGDSSNSSAGGMCIITGPNMGGKSTYIRMAAVITLMAHVGSFVPAKDASVPITDRILARVGAGDNQLRGVSTFMAEMLETATILRSATENSLIVIDELGRGTSTYDGFGLAYAISEYIVTKIKSSCLFATHFHELTTIASAYQSVRNLHVTATSSTEGKLIFLYEVKKGACDESFGIHVAEMAGFPQKVIQAAKRKAAELEETDENPSTEKQEGKRLIKAFLHEFQKLPISELSPEQAVNSVTELKEKMLVNAGNQYLEQVLNN